MDTLDTDLERIKNQWHESKRYAMIEQQPYQIFDKAQKDISYLLNRLEAAERAARQTAALNQKLKEQIIRETK